MSETTTHFEDGTVRIDIDEDERHRLLADEERRAVIDVLDDRTGAVSMSDLADDVARESDGDSDRRNVEIQLHHTHLPMFEDAGLVAYDRDAGLVDAHHALSTLTH